MPANKARGRGSYAPLSAHYYLDDAIARAGEAAELLFLRGLAFTAGVLSDGVITDAQLDRGPGVGMPDAEERAERLVEVGLWERIDGGYHIRSWLDWNWSRERILEAAAKDAARKSPGQGGPPPPTPPGSGDDARQAERTPDGLRAESQQSPNGVPRNSERSPSGVRSDSAPRARDKHPDPDPDPDPDDKPSSPRSARGTDDPQPNFADFYAAYPRHVGRKAAEKAWNKATRDGADPQQVVAAAHRYRQERADADSRYTKHPATWLNAGCWDDEPEPPPALRLVSGDTRKPTVDQRLDDVDAACDAAFGNRPAGGAR